MDFRNLGTRILLAAGLAAVVSTGCPSGESTSIRIVSPRDGDSFTAEDDVSPAVSGVQINVNVGMTGFSNGQDVHLAVNDGDTFASDRIYDGSGNVIFNDVTLEPGENVIRVSAGSQRATVTVTLTGEVCPDLRFVDPADSARLETVDDADRNPANGFQYDVRLATDAADGTSVELQVGGSSVATASAADGFVQFAAVTLADAYPDTSTSMTLRAQTSGVCSATVAVQIVRVEPCPDFTFTTPRGGETFGLADDADGNPENGFQHDVVVSTDAAPGTEIQLLVNGSVVGTTTVTGTVASWSAVDLQEGDVVLRVQVRDDCGEEITVTVDTGAPTCEIRSPTGGWLNRGDDADPGTPGLETPFEVGSDAGDGQPVALIIDGVETGAPTANLSGGQARFASIALADGSHTVRARCRSAAGNVGFSASLTYDVDTVLPTCAVTSPADDTWFNPGDDALTAVDGVQVEVDIATTDRPAEASVARCGSDPLDPEGFVTLDGAGSGSGFVTLAGPGNEVCCNVEDAAGNAGEGRITLNLETDAPQFEIRRPDAATDRILAVADEGPTDTLCQYTVTVGCSNLGRDVTLLVNSVPKPAAPCTASSDPLGGTATWASTVLPQGSVTLRAEGSSAGGLLGTSPDKTVTIDTEPPVLTITRPTCGMTLNAAEDEVGATPGFQYTVSIYSTVSPATLEVTDGAGMPITGSPYSGSGLAPGTITFRAVTLSPGSSGSARLVVRATDENGQPGVSTPFPCTIEIREVPQVRITAPAAGARLGPADDCAPGTPGFQLGVTVSTNIPAGAGNVELFIAGASAGSQSYPGSPVTFCVNAADGTDVLVRAQGTDPRGTGSHELRVTIDSTPPDDPITDLAITVFNRRGGQIDLAWVAPADAGGGSVAGYQIRCATAGTTPVPFTWATATPYSFTGVAGAPGSPQTQRLAGFRIERHVACMVRATDAVGSLGPEGNQAETGLFFQQAEIPGASAATQLGGAVSPLGDVNGDTLPDFIVGARGVASAYLVFGRSGGTSPSALAVELAGAAGSGFGLGVAGIGDFNGDTVSDFAVAAAREDTNRGRVYLYYGRTGAWPAVLSSADADVFVRLDDPASSSDDSAFFGSSLAPAGDYDGDGRKDLLVGAPGWNSNTGAALLLFGRSLPHGTTITVPGDFSAGFEGDLWFSSGVAGSRFGASSAAAYRLNADTADDILLGAPSSSDGGRIHISFGRPRAAMTALRSVTTFDATIVSPRSGSIGFGTSVAPADADGDGDADILAYVVQHPGTTGSNGAVLLYTNLGGGAFGASASTVFENDVSGNANDLYGFPLASAYFLGSNVLARLDGDTAPDLLFSSVQHGADGGSAVVFFGRSFPAVVPRSTADLTFRAPAGDTASRCVASFVGDVTGDGFPDLAVGHTMTGGGAGRIVVVH